MNGKNIPKIVFKQDTSKSIKIFCDFFYNKAPLFQKEAIYRHPSIAHLAEVLEKEGRPELESFVLKYLETEAKMIDGFMANVEFEFKKNGVQSFNVLSRIMEYDWPENSPDFFVVPNIMSGTPFDEKNGIVFLSIFVPVNYDDERIKNGTYRRFPAVPVIIHELCHIIFYRILQRDSRHIQSSAIRHLAHEVLAPVVMNQPELKEILQLENYWGNPYLKPINFKTKEFEVNMVDFVASLYEQQKKNGGTFKTFVHEMLDVFESVQDDLEEKMKIWNINGSKIFKDQETRERYQTPIKINA